MLNDISTTRVQHNASLIVHWSWEVCEKTHNTDGWAVLARFSSGDRMDVF